MRREHVIPVDPETEQAIRRQQDDVRRRFGDRAPLLFPTSHQNRDGTKPFSQGGVMGNVARWVRRCDIRDSEGEPVKIVSHQFRHTIASRMINSDIRIDVVQDYLAHESPRMTRRYAKIHDSTLKTEFERYRQVRVNSQGEPVKLLGGEIGGDARWLKEKFKTLALADGYCGLPLNRHCPHPNACRACVHFQTDITFLDQHRHHREECRALVDQARKDGKDRWAEMNERTVTRLDKIVDSLEQLMEDHDAS